MSSHRLQLALSAKRLPNVAGMLHKSDPFAIVTVLGEDPEGHPSVLGQTEVIYNDLSPSWATLFIIEDYKFGRPLYFEVGVFDFNHAQRSGAEGDSSGRNLPSHKIMGMAQFEVGEILGSRGNVVSKSLKKGGVIYAHIETSAGNSSEGSILFQLRGLGLANAQADLMFQRKSSPFFEIYRREDRATGADWNNVFRSNIERSNLNPVWEESVMDLERFCNNDLDRSIKVCVWDYRKSGNHKLMGEFETSVRRFVEAKSTKGNADHDMAFTLRRNGNKVGQIVVVEARILQRETEASAAAAAPAKPPRPQFVDYLAGGCEINLFVAIDFTASNGNPRMEGTPHYQRPPPVDGEPRRTQQFNDYEKAIYSVGSILAKFDSDQKFPVWGFGLKFDDKVDHCFQCGAEAEVSGVRGMLEAYQGMFRTRLRMSNPTVFTEVIRTAAEFAREKENDATSEGHLSYSVLLILTTGNVHDVHETKMELARASSSPLSVVIVGIGGVNFDGMQFLDDHDPESEPGRDITQFVRFEEHRSMNSLSRAVLEEIPDQLVNYYFERGIMPAAAEKREADAVPVQPADDREADETRFFS